jgi:predicted DNA-binding transcriptional regulator YafY
MLAELVGERAVRNAERLVDDDPDGWRRLRLEIDWPDEVPARLVALGDAVEIIEPLELRQRVLEVAQRAVARHAPA